MVPDTPTIAVLTGDLVASTRLGEDRLARALAALETCARTQAGWHGAALHFTRQRGDGWQVALRRPAYALRSALAFRAALKATDAATDSYIGIATGPRPPRIGPDLNSASGTVFIRSGQKLDDLKLGNGPVRMTYARPGPLDAAVIAADHISQGWTGAQAKAMLPALDPDFDGNLSGLARSLDKSRQSVTKSLHAAGYEAIDLMLASLEKGLEHEGGQDLADG